MKQIRKRLTYANVMSSIAVFVVLGGGAIAATQLPKNSVGSKQLKKNAVKASKIANNAVNGAKIADGAVTGAEIADNAVGSTEIADGSVTSTKIADGSVTTTKIADGSVTTTKIADNAVNGAKVDEASLGEVPSAKNASTLGGSPPSAYQSKAFHVQNDGLVGLTGTGTTTVATLALPAGTYAVFARATINNNGAATNATTVECNLTAGGSSIEVRNLFLGANFAAGESEDISAQVVSTLASPGAATLNCDTNGFSGNVITPEITAISVQP